MKVARVWLGVGVVGCMVLFAAAVHFSYTVALWHRTCRRAAALPNVAIVQHLQERADALAAHICGYVRQCRESCQARLAEDGDALSHQLVVYERWAQIERCAAELKVSLPAVDVAACAGENTNKMSLFLHCLATVVKAQPVKIIDADYEREGAPPVWTPACPLWRDTLPYVKTTLVHFRVQANFDNFRKLLQMFAEDPVPCAVRNLSVTSLPVGLEYDLTLECVENMEVPV